MTLAVVAPLHAASCPGFTTLTTRPAVGTNPSRMATADFNGDGKPDLVVTNLNGTNVSVLMGNGDGTFATRVNYTCGAAPTEAAVGDFDGDGHPDFAVSVASSGVAVFINHGNGTFANRVLYGAGTGFSAIAAADVNGDGKLDLVAATGNGIAVFLGNGNGTFGSATNFAADSTTNGVVLRDFNGDGKIDAAVSNIDSSDVSILLGNGNGTFGAATNYAVGPSPYGIAAADFNHDGKLDIVTASQPDTGDDISILLGNGNGTFTPAVSYGGSNFYGVTVGDFNNDGNIDVAAPSVDSNLIFVYTGTGTGAFAAPATYAPSASGTNYPYSVLAVDLNGDGGIDIASSNYQTNDVSIYMNGCSTVPTISSISPSSGPSAGAQSVTITGNNLSGATSVTFGGTAATVTNNTGTSITVTTPAHAAGTVNVVAVVTMGTATSTNGYTFADPPTVTSVAPTSGPAAGGQSVVITGTNLAGASNVKFATSNATITGTTATTVTVTSPAHAAGAVDVVVTTGGGAATLTASYTYIAAPTISGVAPNSGPSAGGQTGVVISGTNLTGATAVTFGGTAATITNVAATAVTVTTPAHAAGSVAVAVTTPGGTATSNNAYTYAAAPTVTTLSPNSGTSAGGQTGVVINGTGLSTAASVTFGGATATITGKTSTTVTVTTPAHAAGAVNVVVTTGGGSATATNGFTYLDPPTITGVSPSAGPIAGGQTGVVISGTNLTGTSNVKFATTNATVTNVTASAVTVTTPAHAAGSVNVSLTTPAGSVTSSNAYTYVAAPTVSGVSPNKGPTAGGQTGVVITGTNLSGATSVTFGGTGATITNNTATTITVTTPAHAAGAVNVVVTATGGSVTSTNAFTYIATPTVSGISPNAGPVAGGQTGVVISGTNLSSTTSVSFDGTAATITNNTSTTVTVTTPAHPAAGNVSVVVTTAGGTAAGAYTYQAGPATHLVLAAPSSATAGVAISFTVTALDAFENVATAYSGTVHFTSSDGAVTLPTDTTLTSGGGTFSATLHTAGSQTISAGDGSLSTMSGPIAVGTGAATHFALGAPASAVAGGAFPVNITAYDAFENVVTGYAGTVHFTSSDGTATLPADSTLTNGAGTFSTTLRQAALQTITATDGAITGSASVNVAHGAAAALDATAPASATAGLAYSLTVTLFDAFGNQINDYAGTVHFTSSDPAATLPADSTVAGGQQGFSVTLRSTGSRTVTVSDGTLSDNAATVVSPAATDHFVVSAPSAATAGATMNFTVTAVDAFGNLTPTYAGTIHFTSSDSAATLPADSALTNGIGSFQAVFRTSGSQAITGTDGSIAGTTMPISVNAATATHITLTTPPTAIAGTPISVTATARDLFENVATGYSGTLHFTSSDATATLPANTTLVNGSGTFDATLRIAGAQTITVNDGTIGVTSNDINVAASSATRLVVTAPSSATAGSAFNFTVTAHDAFDNVAVTYGGTIHITSSDGTATLPSDATLTNGTGTLSATLRIAGLQTLTAADGTFTATSDSINVAPAAASRFALTAPASAIAGNAIAVGVTAYDSFDNVAIGYGGTLHFTSTDATATLPADAALTNGAGTFNATLRMAGAQTITAADGSITGSASISVTHAAAAVFDATAPATATAGAAFSLALTITDAFGNQVGGYAGTVHFTSTDPTATLPADSTVAGGHGTFSVTLREVGARTVTVGDGSLSDSVSVNVSSSATTKLVITVPSTATAGASFGASVTAEDAFGNVTPSYAGTVHFTSDDAGATLPTDATLTAGSGTFMVTMRTAGLRTITVADGTLAVTSDPIVVSPAPATHFTVVAPANATAGASFTFTVAAHDAFDNVDTAYSGTAHFTSSDATATLPGDATLTNGSATFNATLRIAASQTISVGDGTISGDSNAIHVAPGATTHFAVSAPSTATAGIAISVSITARDTFENVVTAYAGTIHFTSSDATATLPTDSTLTSGTGTFNTTLRIAAMQTISVADGALTGTSNPIDVTPGATTHFVVGAPSTATAGVAISVSVTARDAFENIATSYSGTIHFTSSDSVATLPVNSTLTNGSGTFNATLVSAGTRTIAVADGVLGGSSGSINVQPAAAARFVVTAPPTALAGNPISVSVTARDAFDNVTTAYAGTVHFTSSDGAATLPADGNLTGGTGTFNATLRTAGSRTITATDGGVTGTTGAIAVSSSTATHFLVTAPSSTVAGASFSVTVTALDGFENTVTGYSGTVHFTSSDGTGTLPADTTLTGGIGTFTATLHNAGNQTISVNDGTSTGTSAAIDVTASAAIQFVLSAPASATAGNPFDITVTAVDAFGNTATAFSGSVHFTSNDTQATLAADGTLTNGVGLFNTTLATAGTSTVTASSGAISGQSSVDVVPGAATQLIASAPAATIAGEPFAITVTARDAFGNVAIAYAGTIHVTTSDAQATLPADATLTAGVGTFNLTLHTVGSQLLTISDGTLIGKTNVTVNPAAATHFAIEAGSGGNIGAQSAGIAFPIRVTALDAFGNVDTAFSGNATVTTNAGSISPSTITFAGADAGTHTGNVSVTQAGSDRGITVTLGAVTGSSNPFDVTSGALDHFIVEAAGGGAIGAQTTDVPFAIRITAQDTLGNVVMSFNGTADITSTGQLTSGGGATESFVAGILASHSVSIDADGSATITATSGTAHGTSNTFVVGAIADLSVAFTGSTNALPGAAVSYSLVVRNAGPSSAHAPLLTLALPSGWSPAISAPCASGFPCTLTDLGPSATVTISIAATVPLGSSGTYDVTTGISSATPDASTTNNHAVVHTTVNASTDCPTAPAELMPADGATAPTSGTLRWNASGADSYDVYLGSELNGCAILVGETAGTSFDYHGLAAGQRYTWRVVARRDGCDSITSACVVFQATDACPSVTTLIPAVVAEVSSGATYHVTWNQAEATSYQLQEASDESFRDAVATNVTANSATFRHEAAATTAYYYRVRPVIACLGELEYSATARIVVQPRQASGASLDLMVENGGTDTLTETVHINALPAAAGTSTVPSSFVAHSDQPWLSVAPASGSIPPAGVDLTLTVAAAGRPVGTSVATATLASTSGSALTNMRVDLHVAPAMTLQPRSIPVPANDALVPGVAHAPGASTLWQSDVRLFNASGSQTTYQLSFTPSGQSGVSNGRRVNVDVAPGVTVAFDDIVRHLFGYGAMADESAIGTLDIRPADPTTRAIVTSRTYAVTESGTYGQSIPALTTPSFAGHGATLSLQHLAQSAAYRTNVGLAEVSGHPVSVRLHVFDDAGYELAHYDATLGPLEQRQYNSLLADLGVSADDARIGVEVTSDEGLVGAYASIVDNHTSDPTLVPGVIPATVQASRYVVPGIADFDTGHNTWRSDLRIFNAAMASVTADVIFVPQNDGTPITRQVAIAAGEVKAFDSILRTLFGVNGTGGAVHILTPGTSSLVITARTYDAEDGGTYGQFIPAVTSPDATALGERPLEILHIEQTAAYRANIGLVEIAGNAAQVEVTATLPDGRTTSTTVALAPYEFRQLTSMLQTLGFDGATNARLTLRVVGGTGRVTGYASIIDNRTGDPTYMTAQ